jgi:hypothetical protein
MRGTAVAQRDTIPDVSRQRRDDLAFPAFIYLENVQDRQIFNPRRPDL